MNMLAALVLTAPIASLVAVLAPPGDGSEMQSSTWV